MTDASSIRTDERTAPVEIADPESGSPRENDRTRQPGRFRRWDGVDVHGRFLVSKRPLQVTRVNEAAADVVAALADGEYYEPATVADRVGMDPGEVADLLVGLHERGFLEWRPARTGSHLPPVSVVVTVRDAADDIEGCLDALAALDYPDYGVVVVDDGSTDGTVEMARSHPLATDGVLDIVKVGSPDEPLGIGASRNRGVEAATHDVVAFTDADCRPQSDWLGDLVPCLAAHHVVGGRVRPHGDAAVDVYEGVNASLDMGPYGARVDPDGNTPYLATANLVGRRTAFESVPFPERNVAEDVGFCWRAVEAGLDVVYTPCGVVEHTSRVRPVEFAARRADYAASEALLADEHGYGQRVPVPVLPAVSLLALLLGAVGLLSGADIARTRPGGLPALLIGLGAVGLVGPPAGSAVTRWLRLRPLVGPRDVLESLARSSLSTGYALSREIARYYSVPLGLSGFGVAVFGVAVGTSAVTIGGGGLLALALGCLLVPAAVEYVVHRPPLPPHRYVEWSLLDNLGYQVGAYSGARRYATVAHLAPRRRFRLTGRLPETLARLGERLRGPETSTVQIGSATATFRVDTAAERWWFEERELGGERAVLEDLLASLRPDDVFLDVGANVGLYSCLAGAVLSGERVVAVEPHPRNADRLASNLDANGLNARLLRVAFSDHEARGRLVGTSDEAGSGEHALDRETECAPEQSRNGVSTAVEVVRGDTVVGGEVPPPTVLKIDVEGEEVAVLRGLRQAIDSTCRLVYCEVHPSLLGAQESVSSVRRFLETRGFNVTTLPVDCSDDRVFLRACRSDNRDRRERQSPL